MERVRTFLENRRAFGAAVLIAILLAGSAFLLLYRLGAEPFQDYDEATYAEITNEALANHSYISLTFLHNPYFHKPPLLFWMTDVSKSLISSAEFADRLPSALSAFAAIILLLIFIYAATNSFGAALVGGITLATTAAFMESARQVRFDTLVSFFDLFTFYAFWRGLKDPRWFLLFGAGTGLAILSKGPLVIYAAVPVLTLVLIERRWDWLKSKYVWGGALIAALIVLPWHIVMTFEYGAAFWQDYVLGQVVNRVANTLFTLQPTNLGYLMYALTFGAPWAELFGGLVIIGFALRKRFNPGNTGIFWGAVAAVAAVFAVDGITQTKAFSYLIPLYPFMALAIGIGTYELFRALMPLERYAAGIALFACMVGGLIWGTYNTLHLNPYYDVQVHIADEEYQIAELLKAHAPGNFADFDATMLGNIMFYSGFVTPEFIPSDAPLHKGTYILYPNGETQKLQSQYPDRVFTSAYEGNWLDVAVVAN